MADIPADQLVAILDKSPAPHDEVMRQLIANGHTFAGKQFDPNTLKPIKAPEENGILPENPIETVAKLGQLAGQQLKSFGGEAGMTALGGGNNNTESYGGKAGMLGQGLETGSKLAAAAMPKTPMQVGVMEGFGAVAGLAERPISWATQKIAPEVMAGIKALADMGIPVTPAEASQGSFLSAVESTLARVPFASGIMERFKAARNAGLMEARDALLQTFGKGKEAQALGQETKEAVNLRLNANEMGRTDALERVRNGLLPRTGPEMSSPELGQNIKSIVEEKSGAAKDKASKLYQAVGDSIPEELNLFQADGLRETARRILAQKGSAPSTLEAGIKSELQAIIDAPQGLTWQKMHDLQSDYGSRAASANYAIKSGSSAQGFGTVESAIYSQLKQATRSDMAKAAEHMGSDTQAKYELATSFYKDFKDKFANDTIKRVLKTNAEDVYDSIVKPGDVTDIRRLKTIVGVDGFRPMRRQFMEDMVGGKTDEVPNAAQIIKKMATYGKDTLNEMLTPVQVIQLKNFTATAQLPKFIQSEIEGRLRGIMSQDPEKITNFILAGNTTVASAVKNIVGPQKFEPYRRALVEKMIGEEGGELFTSGKIAKALKQNYDPEYLRLFFKDSELKQMENIGFAKGVMETADKKWGNPSGTGKALISGGTAGIALMNPYTGAKIALTGPVLAKFYLSDTGRRILTQGFNSSEHMAMANFIRIAAFANNAVQELAKEKKNELPPQQTLSQAESGK